MPHHALAVVTTATALCCPLLAQTFVTLPEYADTVDCHASSGLPFGTPSFRTQLLIDATAVAPIGALIDAIEFRADRWLAPAGAIQVPNVTVTLSHTSATLATVSTTFAANVTGATTVAFQGTVALPAQGTGLHGPLPWNITVQFPQSFVFTASLGNLLVDIAAANAPGGSPSYFLDAFQGGGAATQYGVSGTHPTFDNLLLFVATGNDVIPRLISPGHTIDFLTTMFFTMPPAVFALGTAPQAIPIDLTALGAPSNTLYIDPILLATLGWTSTPIGFAAPFFLTVPNNPAFVGTTLYGQSAVLVPAANPLGLITSHAVEARLGDEFEIVRVRQIDAPNASSPAGTLLDLGPGPQPEPGAVAFRLGGLFF